MLTNEEVAEQLHLVTGFFRSWRPRLIARSGNIAYSRKEDQTVVTELDIAMEQSLAKALKNEFPATPLYGEETVHYNADESLFWLVDPIDGTQSFIDGIPTFSNMAALIEHGKIRAAAIYSPARDDLYTAIAGMGAFKNNQRIHINDTPPPQVALLKSVLHHPMSQILHEYDFEFVEPPSGGGDGFTQIVDNIAAVRFQLRASGSAHDYAPGALLVLEAGGCIIPIKDKIYIFESNSFIACHPAVEGALRAHIKDIKLLEKP